MSEINFRALNSHNFHIPVMGLAYTIDTPLKVARFGISSVVSVMEDQLIEDMRAFHSRTNGMPYTRIEGDHADARAERITAYLNLLHDLVERQMQMLKRGRFDVPGDLQTYFDMLPPDSPLKQAYSSMQNCTDAAEKLAIQECLRQMLIPGDIDINIMTKLDKINYLKDGTELAPEYADAMSALRGFAKSRLSSSVVFSAGLNPRLYSYCEQFADFFPDEKGILKKRIILKVSDYRSARIQGLFFAKKGIWVSEFRVESGLNCGGHAFATDGLLMGPILEEFKQKQNELRSELFDACRSALAASGKGVFHSMPSLKITAQGGVGTAGENRFLMTHYGLSSVGWGSPFLLVPEATSVDEETLNTLVKAKPSDYYLSNASPLGVPFNNLRNSSSEAQRLQRIEKGRPGSPCYKKYLAFDTEFTDKPICTASRQYQQLKIAQINLECADPEERADKIRVLEERDCLCEGLGVPALLKNGIEPPHKLNAVVICPGPNLSYFSGVFSLRQMTDHIYGNASLLNQVPRPHVFVNELILYINYLEKQLETTKDKLNAKLTKNYIGFKDNLKQGMAYYSGIVQQIKAADFAAGNRFTEELQMAGKLLNGLEQRFSNVFSAA